MPEPPDNYEPTEADIDLVVEEATGKPVKPANLTDGIASMQRRIATRSYLPTRQAALSSLPTAPRP